MEVISLNKDLIDEHIRTALYGLGLSYGLTSNILPNEFTRKENLEIVEKLEKVADRLAMKGGGHNEFLIHVPVKLLVSAPRFWWEEFIQYRFSDVFPTKQLNISDLSESTMHTLTHRKLYQGDFEYLINREYLNYLNELLNRVKDKTISLEYLKNALPEGFIQKRVVCLNYLNIQNICNQRLKHKLPQWKIFIKEMITLPKRNWLISEENIERVLCNTPFYTSDI